MTATMLDVELGYPAKSQMPASFAVADSILTDSLSDFSTS